MFVLVAGLVIFLGVHSARIVAPGYRGSFVARHGETAWKGLYSAVSLAGFILIVWGYAMARAEPVVLWVPPVWTRHLALALMLPVFVLLAAAYLPGRIQMTLRHPMLAGVKLWAVAHLLANGTLADVVLFGSFLAWAVTDRIAVKRRRDDMSADRQGIARASNDVLALVIGLVAYAATVLWLHERLIGVSPL